MKMIDVHCHILPAVDDGAGSLDESRRMLEIAYKEGIRTIFATSHYHSEMKDDVWKRKKEALMQTRAEAEKISANLRIVPGAEVFYSEKAVEELAEGRIWTMNGSSYVLTEFAPYEEYSYIKRGLQNLQYHGFWPILAHAERYEELADQQRVAELVSMGVFIQINAGSVLGKNGRQIKKYVLKLLKSRQVHFIGTDAHGSRHRRPLMEKCAAYIKRKTDEQYCRMICQENARKIIRREYIDE